MRKTDLFIGVYPGGTQFSDRNRREHGDYKKLAFVRAYGQINYETPREKIPADIVERIERQARKQREIFEENARRDWQADRNRTYFRLADGLSWEDWQRVKAEPDDARKLAAIFEAYERPNAYEVTPE